MESPTTKNSIANLIADSVGVAYGMMNFVIAGKPRQAEIERQLRAFGASARNSGSATISFSVDAPSVAAVRSSISWFKQNGITMVFPSKLVKNRTE